MKQDNIIIEISLKILFQDLVYFSHADVQILISLNISVFVIKCFNVYCEHLTKSRYNKMTARS